MSGFEVAGIVLGAFPIALHVLDDYREMAKRAGLWYRIRLEHARCRNEVKFQSVTLNSHMRRLILPLLVDDAKINQLLSDLGGESWKEPAIEALLKDRLGHAYDLYLDYMKGMEETMIRLNKELSMDSNSVQEQLNSPVEWPSNYPARVAVNLLTTKTETSGGTDRDEERRCQGRVPTLQGQIQQRRSQTEGTPGPAARVQRQAREAVEHQ